MRLFIPTERNPARHLNPLAGISTTENQLVMLNCRATPMERPHGSALLIVQKLMRKNVPPPLLIKYQ
jgi:hypothetical protein